MHNSEKNHDFRCNIYADNFRPSTDPIIFDTAIFIAWFGTEKSTTMIRWRPCQMPSSMTKND